MERYDVLESISSGKDFALSEENAELVSIANDIRRATEDCRRDETQSGDCNVDVVVLS